MGEAPTHALHASIAFLASIQELQAVHSHSTILLRATPDGTYILSHAKRENSTKNTNFVVSIEDPAAYAMLATQNGPIKMTLNTNTTSREQIRQQITLNNITAHTRSVLGRN